MDRPLKRHYTPSVCYGILVLTELPFTKYQLLQKANPEFIDPWGFRNLIRRFAELTAGV
jgi:hypothetical protein